MKTPTKSFFKSASKEISDALGIQHRAPAFDALMRAAEEKNGVILKKGDFSYWADWYRVSSYVGEPPVWTGHIKVVVESQIGTFQEQNHA